MESGRVFFGDLGVDNRDYIIFIPIDSPTSGTKVFRV